MGQRATPPPSVAGFQIVGYNFETQNQDATLKTQKYLRLLITSSLLRESQKWLRIVFPLGCIPMCTYLEPVAET